MGRLLLTVSMLCMAMVAVTAASASPPPGATARCRDGTYSYSHHRSGTCSHHGGVAKWLTGSGSTGSSGSCGVERWAVKTLQDRPHLLANRLTTVRQLVRRRPPSYLPTTRLPFERHVFTVVASVTLVRHEDDSDLHLVLQEGGYHMIAEAPAPFCDRRAKPRLHREMAVARRHVRLCTRARVTGVAFFDFDHGQTGVAPNAIELHPILHFRCLHG